MENSLLYPAYPLMHVGIGEGYVDYLLSGVLATHGYVIRDIRFENGEMHVICCQYYSDDGDRRTIMIKPFCSTTAEFPGAIHWNELRLRYASDGGKLSDPSWMVAVSYRSGLPGDDRIAVVDLMSDEYFHQ